jgi:hypothetical protein
VRYQRVGQLELAFADNQSVKPRLPLASKLHGPVGFPRLPTVG